MILHLIHNPKEKKQFCQQVLLYSFYHKKLSNVLLELSKCVIKIREMKYKLNLKNRENAYGTGIYLIRRNNSGYS